MKTHYRLLAVALGLLGTVAWAQNPSAPQTKVYSKHTVFKLPFNIDENQRGDVREVKLYVKNGASGAWVCKESAPPTQKAFSYTVGGDGEYWFSVVTVDRSGRANPPDVNREPAQLVVVVDTKAPEFDLRPVTSATGETMLHCHIRDANPDYAKSKIEYRSERGWQVLEQVGGDQPGMYRCPNSSMKGVVRAVVMDKAGNSTAREIDLSSIHMAEMAPANSHMNAMGTHMPEAGPELSGGIAQTDYRADKPALPTPALSSSRPAGTPTLQLINKTHVPLEYQVDGTGPSGVGKIEVWITSDEGQSWRKLSEDMHCKSPVEIELPGEGLFGISLVAYNGAGGGAATPARGDVPDCWVEVDTTKPDAQLMAVRPALTDEGSQFLITWTASDKNLKAAPIDLYYSNQHEGPWMPIGRNIKNTGSYRWPVPRGAGPEFYFRMDVWDRAGNVTRCMSNQPLVMDMSRPKAHVLGIAGASMGYGN